MSWPRASRTVLSIWGFAALALAIPALAVDPPQIPPATVSRPVGPDIVVLQAVMGNPVTAPYRIATSLRGRQVVLSGRVGTKQVHDVALQVAMATGYPIRDDLTIAT